MTFLYALIKIHSTRQNFPETRYKGMYKKVFVRVKDAIEELESMPKKLRKTFVVRRFRFIGKGLPKQVYHGILYTSQTIDGKKEISEYSLKLYDSKINLRYNDSVCTEVPDGVHMIRATPGMNKPGPTSATIPTYS